MPIIHGLNLTLVFFNMFDVQELEQNIKELEKYESLPSITQDKEWEKGQEHFEWIAENYIRDGSP